ncbi:MAG: Signal peptidase-like protein [Bacteroidetes bacterium]|nr:Signal peptidase-like protein [Bacteroidota bacterium]
MGCGSGGSCGTGGCGTGGCGTGQCGTGGGCPLPRTLDWLNTIGQDHPQVAYEAVEVTFKGGRKEFFRNTLQLELQTGDYVVVEADRGHDFGTIHMRGEMVRLRMKAEEIDNDALLPNVIRRATLADIEQWEDLKEEEAESFHICREAIDALKLPMKLVDAEWQFDRKKVTFFFTADHRVDFRALVRKLARIFKTRVELRQIGARDEAARVGGIGSCGRELCCSTWLQEFQPVSTQAAKLQNLPLNPTRLSGQCGRLKCCLNYELEQYMQELQDFPQVDTPIETDAGRGTVQKLDIFKERVWIQYPDGTWEDRPLAEVQQILNQQQP